MKSSLPTGKRLELNRTAEKWRKCGPEIPALVVLEVCLVIAGCGGSGSNNPPVVSTTQPPASNPTPMITSLSPPCIPAGELAFTLSVEGQSFASGSIVRWNGSDRPSTFISSNKLTAQIPASDIAAAGTAAITVFNPADGSLLSTRSPLTIAAGGVPPVSVAVDPGGKFAYVVGVVESCGEGFLSTYSINPATGVLTNAVPDMDLGDGARRFVAVDPSGKFVYVTDGENDDLATVMSYAINTATGELTSAGFAYGFCGVKCDPSWLAVDPSGRFVYVADDGGSSVSTLSIDGTTGGLTFKNITAAGQASSVAVDPSGKFVYVTNRDSNNVSMYTTNPTTGALTATGTIAAGTSPTSVTVDPSGKFAYATNLVSNDVSMYMINTENGTLTPIGTIAAGSSPTSIAIHPSGKFAYVTNLDSDNVSIYSIDPGTGALTLIGTIGT